MNDTHGHIDIDYSAYMWCGVVKVTSNNAPLKEHEGPLKGFC